MRLSTLAILTIATLGVTEQVDLTPVQAQSSAQETENGDAATPTFPSDLSLLKKEAGESVEQPDITKTIEDSLPTDRAGNATETIAQISPTQTKPTPRKHLNTLFFKPQNPEVLSPLSLVQETESRGLPFFQGIANESFSVLSSPTAQKLPSKLAPLNASQLKNLKSVFHPQISPISLAQNPPLTQHQASELGGEIELNQVAENLAQRREEIPDVEGAYINDVQIRFVNAKGEDVERDGNPIERRVSEDFVRGEIQLKPGDTYSRQAVLRDLQQLHQLGIFRNVTVTTESVGTDINVIYNVREITTRIPNFGGGYNDDLGVFLILGARQVIGRTERISAVFQPSLRDFEYDLRFISPYVAGENRLGYSIGTFRDRRVSDIFNEEVTLPDEERVREIRMGGNVTVSRPLGDWRGTLGLNYTSITTRDRDLTIVRRDEEGNPLTWSRRGVDELYTVSFAATRDWRNNPFNPTRGAILTLSTQQSIPLGAGNILMNRVLANYIQYVPFRWLGKNDPDSLPEMFAFNLQAGTVFGEFPPAEAFRLGGSNSVRGYNSGEVGTGRSYFLASGEYRFPIGRDVGGVLFLDFATDLGSADSVLGKPALVRDKPGTGAGAGFGLRVRSQFGLLRLDLAVSDQGNVQVLFGTGQRF